MENRALTRFQLSIPHNIRDFHSKRLVNERKLLNRRDLDVIPELRYVIFTEAICM